MTAQIGEYAIACGQVARSFPGWNVKIIKDLLSLSVATEWRCPHGENQPNMISLLALEHAVLTADPIAQMQYEQAAIGCLRAHVGKPITNRLPAGSSVRAFHVDINHQYGPVGFFPGGTNAAQYVIPQPSAVRLHVDIDVAYESAQEWQALLQGAGGHEPMTDVQYQSPGYADAVWPGSGVPMLQLQSAPVKDVPKGLADLVPALANEQVACPACKHPLRTLARRIIHLNDQHKWTREQIADWLDTLDIDITLQPIGA